MLITFYKMAIRVTSMLNLMEMATIVKLMYVVNHQG